MSKTATKVNNSSNTDKSDGETTKTSSSSTKASPLNPLTENAYAQSHVRSLFHHGNQLSSRDKLLLSSDLLLAVSQCASLFTVYLAGISQHHMASPNTPDGKKKRPRSILSYQDVVAAAKDIDFPFVWETVSAQAELLDDKKLQQTAERKRAREEKKTSAGAEEDGDKDEEETSEEAPVEKPKKDKKESKKSKDEADVANPAKRQRQAK